MCGKRFPYKKHGIFCSDKCKAKHRRMIGADNVKRICEWCGKEFEVSRFRKDGKGRFCCRQCAVMWVGKKKTEAYQLRMQSNPPPPKPRKPKWFETEEGRKRHADVMASVVPKEHEKVCRVCGKKFISHSHRACVCSEACKRADQRKREVGYVDAVCEVCGKPYRHWKHTESHTCSRVCRQALRRMRKAKARSENGTPKQLSLGI